MKRDPITEEELWRSIPVFFVFFLTIGALDYTGRLSIDGFTIFFLAFVLTAIHFKLMVRYRKKEHMTNPSIFSIIDYTLHRQKPEKVNNKHIKSEQSFWHVLTIVVIAYLIYHYVV